MERNKPHWIFIPLLLLAALACVSSAPTTTAPAEENSLTAPPPTLAAVVPSSTAAPASTNQVIQHVLVPGEPSEPRLSFAGDQDSYITSPEKRAPGGDRFTFGRYERPFNANNMDVYFAQFDIQELSSYGDNSWIYFDVTVKGRDGNQALSGSYGVEIDSDIDGRGDWLVLAHQPASKEWTTDDVEVWYDSNNDVGGTLSVTADALASGDGYETRIFDRGQGDDPDLAWVRIPPGLPFTIRLAIKESLLNSNGIYMAGAWAGNDMLDPSLFDLNDHFTQDQAGSSLVEFEFFYPIKAIAEIDNSCRVAVGFQPSGGEPGLCPVESGSDSCLPSEMVCVDTIYGPNCNCP
jgi:hypothetical protein